MGCSSQIATWSSRGYRLFTLRSSINFVPSPSELCKKEAVQPQIHIDDCMLSHVSVEVYLPHFTPLRLNFSLFLSISSLGNAALLSRPSGISKKVPLSQIHLDNHWLSLVSSKVYLQDFHHGDWTSQSACHESIWRGCTHAQFSRGE